MKHICDTMKDYTDAMNTSFQGDVIYCSEKLWHQIMNEYQPERSKREDRYPNLVTDYLQGYGSDAVL